ncbi:CRISPR-associated endonuclease Cas2 [Frankia tisae]|uniref:CRISPR-associated endonuclease Cas2 n=1 Tax=Frankia tisae TaxID=2950104 RepID=UPI0021BDFAC8|nr:CRISPR-associated endonuclease Cas2 [Frankia tisae]
MNTPLVVVYDITEDARRDQVRAALRPFADRFQQSGWYLPAGSGLTANSVHTGLRGMLAEGDRLGVWQLCPECWRSARWLPEHAWRPAQALPGNAGYLLLDP